MIRAVLKWIGAIILSAALAVVSRNAFPQVLSEFRDTEPGSLLFGVLHLVIGTSAAVACVGMLMRARWAARSIEICGVAAAGLLVLQPVFEPMPVNAQLAIWFGAAVAFAAAMGMGWVARRLAKPAAASGALPDLASVRPLSTVGLPGAQEAAPPMIAPAPSADEPRVASSRTNDDQAIGRQPPTPAP